MQIFNQSTAEYPLAKINQDLILQNDYFIIEMERKLSIAHAVKDKNIKVFKTIEFPSNQIIGQIYGSSFRINDRANIEKITDLKIYQSIITHEELDTFGDGSAIKDSNQSQALSAEEIEKLKSEGKSGESIIKHIVASSSSFIQKTQFSQQKYVKRKSKKYVPIFTVHKATSHNLCDYYYQKFPEKIQSLRPDVLAQVLYFGSIAYDSKVLLFETTQGLLAGSILQMLSSEGELVQFYNGNTISNRIIKEFSPSNDIGRYEKYSIDSSDFTKTISEKYSKYFTSLIIVSKYTPLNLCTLMLPFLMKSSPIVIFCNIIEPLKECYDYFKQNQLCFDLYITDSWFREIQVLPDRTHPEVTMDGRSGFLLRGIYIGNDKN